MMSETTYIGDTKWMQVPEPLSDEELFRWYEKAEYLGFLAYKKGFRDAEKAHGITGGSDE